MAVDRMDPVILLRELRLTLVPEPLTLAAQTVEIGGGSGSLAEGPNRPAEGHTLAVCGFNPCI